LRGGKIKTNLHLYFVKQTFIYSFIDDSGYLSLCRLTLN